MILQADTGTWLQHMMQSAPLFDSVDVTRCLLSATRAPGTSLSGAVRITLPDDEEWELR